MSHQEDQLIPNNKLRPRLTYLCMQATREGQASYAHVYEIIRGLQKRGWSVQLYEPPYNKGNKTPPGPLGRAFWFILTQMKMWLGKRPNVVYIRNHFATLPTAIWARVRNIPTVQEVNGPYEDLFISWPFTKKFAALFKWMIRYQFKLANAIIAVTPQLAEWVKQESDNKNVFVIPNGANIELFKPEAPLCKEINVPDKFVVFFGALSPWQGIDTMLEAVKQPEWPPNVKLLIIGDGIERRKIKDASEDEEKVVYLGTVPYKTVPSIVAKAIVGLSPQNSFRDRGKAGLSPLKVFETLACGVPIILTDFPGVAEIVKEAGCGIVIPPEDPKSLARAVRYLYEHPEERARMGRIGRELVVKEHSWDNRAALTDAILRQLLKGQSKHNEQDSKKT